MNPAPKGKIGRLPMPMCEDVNRRLENGQKRRDDLAAAQPKTQKFRDPKLPLSDEDRLAIIDKVDEIFGLK